MAKLRFRMPPICFIVARAHRSNVIGCEGKLPWKLKTDLGRFRSLTSRHAVIMGRKTYESIGKPLPKRLNIVVSRTSRDRISGIDLHGTGTKLLHSTTIEDALFCSDIYTILNDSKCIFVIGGAEIYRKFSDQVDRIYLTEVFADVKGDAYFDQDFDQAQWKMVAEEDYQEGPDDEFASRFVIFDKRTSVSRLRSFSDIVSKRSKHACMKGITNDDAKIIEHYAASQIDSNERSQLNFSFDSKY